MSLHTWDVPERRRRTRRNGVSIIPFLASKGGLKPHCDLDYILDGRFRHLIRKSGMSLDMAREAAVEARYLQDAAQWSEAESDSTISDLLELIEAEARGMKQYAAGEWPSKPERDKRDPGKEDKRRKQPLGMTKENYLAALSELGLAPQARQTAKLLGLSLRACQRFALGEQQVPDTVALLLGMYQRHGLP